MEYQKKEVRLTEMDNDIVEVDKQSPRFRHAQELMIRMVTAKRAAMLAEAQALDLRQSGVDDSLPDLWGEMPIMGKEHEVSLGDLSSEPLMSEESEFDDRGEMSPC